MTIATTDSLYTIQNVVKRYADRAVLNITDLTIDSGSILALVGPSGAGKSTLLRLLALLEAPTEGQIHLHLNGHALDHESATIDDRRQIAMVFQRPALLTRSVRANIAYGLKLRGVRQTDVIVDEMIARLSLTHVADSHPATLSGGEMQRVAIARALVLRPRILLLDEPTANLDPYNIRLIEDLLLSRHAETDLTLIMVTHNIFQARRLAQRVGLIYEHHLVEVAASEQFFENPDDERTRAFVGGKLVY